MNEFEFYEESHKFRELMTEYMHIVSDMAVGPQDWGDAVIFKMSSIFSDIHKDGLIDLKKINQELEASIKNAKLHRSKKVG